VHQLYFSQYNELQNASDRRTLLGSSLDVLQSWVSGGKKQSRKCLLKMYDENLNRFKLNDVVTVIGVLEVPD